MLADTENIAGVLQLRIARFSSARPAPVLLQGSPRLKGLD